MKHDRCNNLRSDNSSFKNLKKNLRTPFLKFFAPQHSMQASQCTTTPPPPRAGAIFRQKSGRGFLRFSLSLALFPPFPFFRLSLFSAFPFFPPFPLFRGFLKNKSEKSLCGGERDLYNNCFIIVSSCEISA